MLPVSPTAAQIKGHASYRTRTRLRRPQNCGPDVRAVAILRFAKRHHWSRPNQQPHGVSAEPAVAVTASDQPCAERGNRDEAKGSAESSRAGAQAPEWATQQADRTNHTDARGGAPV